MTETIENSDFQREKKTVQLSIISLIMYGIINLINGGPFAFFPINELVFFGVTVYFSFLHYKENKISYLLFLLFSGLALMKNQLFLGFFMSNQQVNDFLNLPVINYLPWMIFAIIWIEIFHFFRLTKKKIVFFPIIISIFIFGTYFNAFTFQVLALHLFFILLVFYFKNQKETSISYSKSLYFLWFLFLFLKLSTLFSMYLYRFELDF